jgi:antirestriction protein ArdC
MTASQTPTKPKTATKRKGSTKPKGERVDAYKVAMDAVLAAMERGTIPWRTPWKMGANGGPRNLSTGNAYRGINVWMLLLAGYTSPYWVTYKQAAALGGQVRKGEKATAAMLWKPFQKRLRTAADIAEAVANGDRIKTDERGKYVDLLTLRTFAVFNVEQVDGLSVPQIEEIGEATWTPEEAAEAIVSGYEDGPSLGEGGESAHYIPARDHVQMPDRGRFDNPGDWYATAFHELAHSTGHADRLNRPDLVDPAATFGSKKYAREELTAEMAAAMLCSVAGIDTAPLTERHAAYVEHWRDRIGQDPRLVVIAAGRAQKAADRILGEEPPAADEDAAAAEEVAA